MSIYVDDIVCCMIVDLEHAPIPEVDLAQTAAWLGRIARRETSGFVVRGNGEEDSGHDTVAAIIRQMALRGGDFPLHPVRVGGITFGWHTDFGPRKEPSHMFVNVHHTTRGSVLARLVVPKPELWTFDDRMGHVILPERARNLLNQDRVDDTLLAPTVHETVLHQGDVLVFSVGGDAPTVHRFVNVPLDQERTSYVHDGYLDVAGHIND